METLETTPTLENLRALVAHLSYDSNYLANLIRNLERKVVTTQLKPLHEITGNPQVEEWNPDYNSESYWMEYANELQTIIHHNVIRLEQLLNVI